MTKPTSPTSTLAVILLLLGFALDVSACGGSSRQLSTPAKVSKTATASSAPPTSRGPTSAAAPASTTTPPTTPASTTSTAPDCGSTLAGSLASTDGATQLVTVDAPTYATTSATVNLWQRQGSCWVAAGGPWPADIGANGFSDHHVEGDGTTPTGAYGIGPVMYGNAPDPGVQYPYHVLVCGDWWDEDPSSPGYNTFQHVTCGETPPFGGGSEALWQETNAYPSFAVVDYNTSPVVPDAGSGIFIHADTGAPTVGCVSLPLADLDTLLRWLQPSAAPLVVMGPDGEIDRF